MWGVRGVRVKPSNRPICDPGPNPSLAPLPNRVQGACRARTPGPAARPRAPANMSMASATREVQLPATAKRNQAPAVGKFQEHAGLGGGGWKWRVGVEADGRPWEAPGDSPPAPDAARRAYGSPGPHPTHPRPQTTAQARTRRPIWPLRPPRGRPWPAQSTHFRRHVERRRSSRLARLGPVDFFARPMSSD